MSANTDREWCDASWTSGDTKSRSLCCEAVPGQSFQTWRQYEHFTS